MFAWAGFIKSYEMATRFRTQDGWDTLLVLSPEDPRDPVHGDVRVEIHFGDHEVGPGEAIGDVRPEPGGIRAVVELPWEGLPTFWRALDQDCLLKISGLEDAITSISTTVYGGNDGDTDKARRERLDSMQRRLEEANES
jgi:hypothetical protein